MPHPLVELLARHLAAREALLLELPLHHDLRGDAGVVGSRQPERVVALHPVMAGQRVHDGLVERVPHVQDAGHVRRRQLDAERRTAGREASTEIAARLPHRIPGALDGRRLEALGQHGDALGVPGRHLRNGCPAQRLWERSRASSARTAWSTMSRNEAATASRVSATSSSISRSIAPPIRLRTIVSICWGNASAIACRIDARSSSSIRVQCCVVELSAGAVARAGGAVAGAGAGRAAAGAGAGRAAAGAGTGDGAGRAGAGAAAFAGAGAALGGKFDGSEVSSGSGAPPGRAFGSWGSVVSNSSGGSVSRSVSTGIDVSSGGSESLAEALMGRRSGASRARSRCPDRP